ncbi:MAG: DUF2304 domain-containing protein [Actinobacteria bacterium]|nr:DUF2304 domain-containing protein [Actinomycetota bacterium]MCG2801485.1 DUF2304 domain-containing protein [Cellulomonas sp.]
MSGYVFAVTAAIALLVFLVVLLRSRRLREKYAITWLVVGAAIAVLGAFPSIMLWLTAAVGIQTPTNLLFAASLIVLLVVDIQLSVEITGLEEETRTLAEEVALLRLEVERGRQVAEGEPPVTPAPEPEP